MRSMLPTKLRIGLTFDDVLLQPAESSVLPRDAQLQTRLSRNLRLKIPLLSAAMDTVTGASTAIAMAQAGGIGVIHKNLSPSQQAQEVMRGKKFESGMVAEPVTIGANESLERALELMRGHNLSGIPVVDGGRLVGMITSRDVRFEASASRNVADIMTTRLVTAREGVQADAALALMHEHRIE